MNSFGWSAQKEYFWKRKAYPQNISGLTLNKCKILDFSLIQVANLEKRIKKQKAYLLVTAYANNH